MRALDSASGLGTRVQSLHGNDITSEDPPQVDSSHVLEGAPVNGLFIASVLESLNAGDVLQQPQPTLHVEHPLRPLRTWGQPSQVPPQKVSRFSTFKGFATKITTVFRSSAPHATRSDTWALTSADNMALSRRCMKQCCMHRQNVC
jgi:hypothetical protein